MQEQTKLDEDDNLMSRASTRVYKGEIYSISDIRNRYENRNKQVFYDRDIISEAIIVLICQPKCKISNIKINLQVT